MKILGKHPIASFFRVFGFGIAAINLAMLIMTPVDTWTVNDFGGMTIWFLIGLFSHKHIQKAKSAKSPEPSNK